MSEVRILVRGEGWSIMVMWTEISRTGPPTGCRLNKIYIARPVEFSSFFPYTLPISVSVVGSFHCTGALQVKDA